MPHAPRALPWTIATALLVAPLLTLAARAQQKDEPVKPAANPRLSQARGERPKAPRIPPLKESEWTPGQRELLQTRAQSGPIFNVHTTIAQNEELFRAWIGFGGHILRGSSLPARDREIAILRIGWLCNSQYEFSQHARIGRTAGLSEEEIARIGKGSAAPGWSEFDATLLRAVEELYADACIAEPTWNALAKRYDKKQLMDLVFTVGQYNLVSMALNSFGVQLDEGVEAYPMKTP